MADALGLLRLAVDGGWAHRRIYTEHSLAPLRADPSFQAMVACVRSKVEEQKPPGDSPRPAQEARQGGALLRG